MSAIHEHPPQGELDAAKWLKAAVHFEDVFGGAGDVSGSDPNDPDFDRRVFIEAVLSAQLRGERPVSTPEEMFPYLIKLTTWLFYSTTNNPRHPGLDPIGDEAIEHDRQVLERVLPGLTEPRRVTAAGGIEPWDVGDPWFELEDGEVPARPPPR